MKKILAILASLAISAAALTACSDKGSSSQSDTASAFQAQAGDSEAEKPAVVVKEPDIKSVITSGAEFINISNDKLLEATDGTFTKENAMVYDETDNEVYAKYSLGKSDSILNGTVKLPAEYEVTTTVNFVKGKLKKYTEYVGNVTKEDADQILDNFIAAYDGKLPDGYTQFKPVEHGKHKEVGFSKTVNDLVISVTKDEHLDGEIYVYFNIEIYAERYQMDKAK